MTDTKCGEQFSYRINTPPARKDNNECNNHWYFTFGCGQKNAGKYVVLYGTCQSTRDKMFELFGDKWAFQYKTAEAAGVEKWKYVRLHVEKEGESWACDCNEEDL